MIRDLQHEAYLARRQELMRRVLELFHGRDGSDGLSISEEEVCQLLELGGYGR